MEEKTPFQQFMDKLTPLVLVGIAVYYIFFGGEREIGYICLVGSIILGRLQ